MRVFCKAIFGKVRDLMRQLTRDDRDGAAVESWKSVSDFAPAALFRLIPNKPLPRSCIDRVMRSELLKQVLYNLAIGCGLMSSHRLDRNDRARLVVLEPGSRPRLLPSILVSV
jgi:hypothetical protein